MNTRKLIVALSSAVALASVPTIAGDAIAAGTAAANLDISASVSANCTITTGAIGFGSYDPIVANASAPLDAAGSVTVTCTNGSSAKITLGQGSNADSGSTDALPLRRMSDGQSAFLSYSLHSDAARSVIWGNTPETGVDHLGTGSATSISVFGRVAQAQNVPAGSYADTVVATVSF